MGRELDGVERALLLHLLRGDAPGHAALRDQVPLARYVRPWFPGALSFDVEVAPGAPTAELPDGNHAETDVDWIDEPGEWDGGLMVWVEDGRLAALEYHWHSDEMPGSYPPLPTAPEPGAPS